MKKTIIENICDDCRKNVKEFALQFDGKDLCSRCVIRRVDYSDSVIPIGAKCPFCEGKGYTKEFYGYNNDYNCVDCPHCAKSGQQQFKEVTNVVGKKG